MSETIKERFVITRQLDIGPGWRDSTTFVAGKSVPGRVLELVRNELLLHLPDLDQDQVEEVTKCVVDRLFRPEVFDFEKAQACDEAWQRGMFKP